MLTLQQLNNLLNNNSLNEVRNECQKYGTILMDKQHEEEGHHSRYLTIKHLGEIWEIDMYDGEVLCVESSSF